MDSKEFYQFKRECYLKSEPSIDLDKVSTDKPIDCNDHKLKLSTCEEIIKEYCTTKNDEEACNLWLLQNGPLLIDDKKF